MDLRTCEVKPYDSLGHVFDSLKDDKRPALLINPARNTTAEFLRGFAAATVLVADFDGTLWPGIHWGLLRSLMPPQLRAESEADKSRYHDFGMTDRELLEFIFRDVTRLVDSQMPPARLAEYAATKAPPRDGARELLASFPDSAIVSFGVWDFIMYWAREHQLKVGDINALHLRWSTYASADDMTPLCAGCVVSSVVTDANKGVIAAAHRAWHSQYTSFGGMAVLGDAPTDARMLEQGDVSVLLLPRHDPDERRARFRRAGLDQLWPNVSAALVSDSLQPLADLRAR